MSESQQDRDAAERRDRTLAGVVDRNIIDLLTHRTDENAAKSREERIADRITGFAGSMSFVWLHLALFGLWIVVNLGWTFIPRFDPTFVILAMAASVEAIFLSTFVLISQNRMSAIEAKRADLDLQISLLAEHQISRLIALNVRIADKIGVEAAQDPTLEELSREIEPRKVLHHMEARTREFHRDSEQTGA